MKLANQIQEIRQDCKVCDVLSGNKRQKLYDIKKAQDFIVHCMMDEVNKLHPSNLTGILKFANARNIYLVNCSPIVVNGDDYKHCYIVEKNIRSQTMISEKESEDNTYIIPIKSHV